MADGEETRDGPLPDEALPSEEPEEEVDTSIMLFNFPYECFLEGGTIYQCEFPQFSNDA
jgi:hypothetical protein